MYKMYPALRSGGINSDLIVEMANNLPRAVIRRYLKANEKGNSTIQEAYLKNIKTEPKGPEDAQLFFEDLRPPLCFFFCFSTASLNSSLSDRASPVHQHSFAELLIYAGARKSTQAINTHKEELTRNQCKKHFKDIPWSPWPFVDSILGRTTVREVMWTAYFI